MTAELISEPAAWRGRGLGQTPAVHAVAAIAPVLAPPAPPAQPTDLEAWTQRLAQGLAEMLAGARSPGQLHGVATLDVIRQVERGYGTFGGRAGESPVRPIVRSVHVREVEAEQAEACAVIAVGGRVRAVALRLDRTARGWCCTAVEAG